MTGTVALVAFIVDSSDGAIVSKTLDGPIVSCNRAAERMYGYSAEEIVGESISLLIPEGSDEMVRILGEIAAGIRVDHYRTTRLRKDGTSVPMSLTVSPNLRSGRSDRPSRRWLVRGYSRMNSVD